MYCNQCKQTVSAEQAFKCFTQGHTITWGNMIPPLEISVKDIGRVIDSGGA